MPDVLRLCGETIDGRASLFALDEPGWYAEGTDEAEALANVPKAIAEFDAWLTVHGEDPPAWPDHWEIAERFTTYGLPGGFEVNGIFAVEREAPSADLVATTIRGLGFCRADLERVAATMPDDGWTQPLGPGERTPAEVLTHIARAECWYLSHFTDAAEVALASEPPGTVEQMLAVQDALVDWLRQASGDDLVRVVVDREEEWTVAKLIRRALWHERIHLRELEDATV